MIRNRLRGDDVADHGLRLRLGLGDLQGDLLAVAVEGFAGDEGSCMAWFSCTSSVRQFFCRADTVSCAGKARNWAR